MNLEIRILSGALANTIRTYNLLPISVGRAPEAGLRFHPTRDLAVSARHALLYPEEGRWWMLDLGSQNGTYHNGRQIDAPVVLADGDRITFGYEGPEVEVGILRTAGIAGRVPGMTAATRARVDWRQYHDEVRSSGQRGSGQHGGQQGGGQPGSGQHGGQQGGGQQGSGQHGGQQGGGQQGSRTQNSGEQRKSPQVGGRAGSRRGDGWRDDGGRDGSGPNSPAHRVRLVQGGAAVVVALVGIILYLVASGERERAVWERERAALLSRLDSLLVAGDVAVRSLEGERDELARALRVAQDELRSARTELGVALAAGNDAQVESLRRELQARTAALERQQLAASLDFDAIEQGSRKAVALVYVERRSGQVLTATAFAVRADGILMSTSHVVGDDDGRSLARRIGVQFSDSEQVFPARLLTLDAERDLALLKVENIRGEVPVVQGFNPHGDTLSPGAPVAVMGFPLGGAPGDPDNGVRTARPLVSSGVIAAWQQERVEIVGYGAAGASGSPIFDARGRVIAVLFGGTKGPERQRIVGVPARHALRLLERIR